NGNAIIHRTGDAAAELRRLNGFMACGQSGESVIRNGTQFKWVRNLKVGLVQNSSERDVTAEILQRSGKGWESLGIGDESQFNRESTQLVDITDLITSAGLEQERVVALKFSLDDSGGRIQYDVLVD